jgi:hypothetical protein
MWTKLLISATALGIAVTFTPTASADPDPHIPNGEAGWCEGGQPGGYGGQRYCLGTAYGDGTFYAQTWGYGPSGPFAPGFWRSGSACSQWIEDSIQGAWMYAGNCGGGPQYLK